MKFAYFGNEAIGAMVEQRLEEAGHNVVDDASLAQVVLTYCTNQTQLEDVYFDSEGVIKNAPEGCLLIDLSATTPQFARELAALGMVSDLLVVEAPLVILDQSASDALVEKDNSTCFLSGEEDAKKKALPILDVLFAAVEDMGDTGAASMARAALTIQSTSAMVSAIEADALYHAVRAMPQGLGMAAAGRAGALSPVSDALLDAVEEGRFDGPCTIEMLMGQVAAALSTAEDAQVALPQTEGIMQLLEVLAIIGAAGKQPAVISLAYREQKDVEEHGLDWSRIQGYADQGSDSNIRYHDDIGGFDDMIDEEDYGFEDDDPGYGYDSERDEEYADFEDDDYID